MNLISLLKIDVMVLNNAERRGLLLAEELWKRAGEPVEPEQLLPVLETILQQSRLKGIRYPPILLLRKKQFQRLGAESGCIKESSAPGDREKLHAEDCSLCGGSGVVMNPTGLTSTLCPNGCFLKRKYQR